MELTEPVKMMLVREATKNPKKSGAVSQSSEKKKKTTQKNKYDVPFGVSAH